MVMPKIKKWVTKLVRIGTTVYLGWVCDCGAHTDVTFNVSQNDLDTGATTDFIKYVDLYKVGPLSGITKGIDHGKQ